MHKLILAAALVACASAAGHSAGRIAHVKAVNTAFWTPANETGNFFNPATYKSLVADDANYSWTKTMPSVPGFKKVDRGYDEFLASATGWWTQFVFESPATKPWTYTFDEATGCVVGANPNTASKPDGTPCGDYLGGVTWCFDDAGKVASVLLVSPPEWDKCYQPEARLAAAEAVFTAFWTPAGQPDNFFNPATYKSLMADDATYTWDKAMPSIPGFKKVDRGFDEFLASATGWWTKIVFESPATKPVTHTFDEATGCVVSSNPNTASKPDGTPCGDYLGGVTWCFDDAGKIESILFVSPPEWDKCYETEARHLATAEGIGKAFFSPAGPDNFFTPDKYKSLMADNTTYTWDKAMPSIPGFTKDARGYDEFLAMATGWMSKIVFEGPDQAPWTYTFDEATGCVVTVTKNNTASKPDGTPCGKFQGGNTACFDEAGKVASMVIVSPPEWDKCYQSVDKSKASLAAAEAVITAFFSPPGPDNFFTPDKYKSLMADNATYTWDKAMPSIPGFTKDARGYDEFLAMATGWMSEVVFSPPDQAPWTYTFDEATGCAVGVTKNNTFSKADGTPCGKFNGGTTFCLDEAGKVASVVNISPPEWDKCYETEARHLAAAEGVITAFFSPPGPDSITTPDKYKSLIADDANFTWDKAMPSIPGFTKDARGYDGFMGHATGWMSKIVFKGPPTNPWTYTFDEATGCVFGVTKNNTFSKPDGTPCGKFSGGNTVCFDEAGKIASVVSVSPPEWDKCYQSAAGGATTTAATTTATPSSASQIAAGAAAVVAVVAAQLC